MDGSRVFTTWNSGDDRPRANNEKGDDWDSPARRIELQKCLWNIPDYTGGIQVADTYTTKIKPGTELPPGTIINTSAKSNNTERIEDWPQLPNGMGPITIWDSDQWIVSKIIGCTLVEASADHPIAGLHYQV